MTQRFVDETDITEQRTWFHKERANAVITHLLKRNLNGLYVANRQEALVAVLNMIPAGATVSRADSITVDQVGIMTELRRRNQNRISWPQEKDGHGNHLMEDPIARANVQREAMFADVFITGTNAITLDGKLVNTDGGGNRVAAMIYGPKKVIVVAGVNKIVRDTEEAFVRIRQVCAPLNGRRHFKMHHRSTFGDLPCVVSGRCVNSDCEHERRMCCYTTIIEGAQLGQKGRISVVLVGDDLGI